MWGLQSTVGTEQGKSREGFTEKAKVLKYQTELRLNPVGDRGPSKGFHHETDNFIVHFERLWTLHGE